ncbi:MAG: Na+/H+ antiporter NhaC [Acidaminococcaceae bacterium]|nr:Na+/H+ antiporter NhaC [Acidaminococcaceae bacterium]MDD4721460.1 Na+/H+ antiporter NhaC [Acidaminococcaceae bacterium]
MRKTILKREPTFIESIVPIIAMLVILFYGKGIKGWATEPLLIIVAIIAAIVAMRVGVTWDEMLDEISIKIAKGMPAILILITVGMLIGTWKASGTIPMMIYYGIQMVNPQYLLVTAFLITALVSIVTGTSWGSVGTMGVALMGIASGLNVSLPATAGAVIAGSYFGDKMSPLSDTTNLAPISAGSDLYGHIRHMFWTTVPATIVSLIVYAVAGASASGGVAPDSETVQVMLSTLNVMYSWSWLLLLPVVIVLVGSVIKMPTIPVMLCSSTVAGIMAIFIQNITLDNVLKCMVKGFNVSMITAPGFNPKTVAWAVTRLINGGGMASIMSTTLLVFCAFCFAGIMSRAGCLKVVLQKLLSIVTNTGGLIASTVVACLTMAITTGSSYLSILIPGEMFKDAYKARNLAAVNLSRTLEDSATVVVPLVPWSAAGAYMTATLGVPTLSYLPWAVLCYTGFIFALFYGFTGIGIKKITQKENIEEQKAE